MKPAALVLSLLALLPVALRPVDVSNECGVVAVPVMSCCCGPAPAACEDCGCSVKAPESGPSSPAAPAEAPHRSNLLAPVAMLIQTPPVASDALCDTSDEHIVRPLGLPVARLRHCVFTL